MIRARQIGDIFDDQSEDSCSDTGDSEQYVAMRIQVRQSPYLDPFYKHHAVRLTIDSGATGNMMRACTAISLGVEIRASSQSAGQADGSSPLKVTGETQIVLVRDECQFKFDALVVEDLDVDVLAGMPFMERNDVSIRPSKRQVIVGGSTIFVYGSGAGAVPHHSIRRAHVLRAPSHRTTVWPGEFIELEVP